MVIPNIPRIRKDINIGFAVNAPHGLVVPVIKHADRKSLADIAKEEKTHMGEFQTLLLKEDEEQVKELEEGKKEVDELTEDWKIFKKW